MDRLTEIRKRFDAIIPEDIDSIIPEDIDSIIPEDIDYLLKRLALAERALASMQTFGSWAMRGQALQGTADAQAQAASDLLAWEEVAAP